MLTAIHQSVIIDTRNHIRMLVTMTLIVHNLCEFIFNFFYIFETTPIAPKPIDHFWYSSFFLITMVILPPKCFYTIDFPPYQSLWMTPKRVHATSVVPQFDDIMSAARYIKVNPLPCVPSSPIGVISTSSVRRLIRIFDEIVLRSSSMET